MMKDFRVGDKIKVVLPTDKETVLKILSVNQYGWFCEIEEQSTHVHVPRTVIAVEVVESQEEEGSEIYGYECIIVCLDSRQFIGCVNIPSLLNSKEFTNHRGLHANNTEMLLTFNPEEAQIDEDGIFEGPLKLSSFNNPSYNFSFMARFPITGKVKDTIFIECIDTNEEDED